MQGTILSKMKVKRNSKGLLVLKRQLTLVNFLNLLKRLVKAFRIMYEPLMDY